MLSAVNRLLRNNGPSIRAFEFRAWTSDCCNGLGGGSAMLIPGSRCATCHCGCICPFHVHPLVAHFDVLECQGRELLKLLRDLIGADDDIEE